MKLEESVEPFPEARAAAMVEKAASGAVCFRTARRRPPAFAVREGDLMRALGAKFLILAILLAPRIFARDVWIEADSEHFTLFTDAGKGRARDVLYDLEQLRRVITESLPSQPVESHVPTAIYLFRSEKSFRDFQPMHEGQAENWTSVFRPMGFKNFIAMTAMDSKEMLRETAFEQYLFLLLSYNDVDYPLWLRNGFSLFYGNANVSKDHADLGKMHERHRRELGEFRAVPLQELLSVDQESSYYRDPGSRARFDAQCWALVHYLLIGRNPEGSAQIAKFLGLLADGKDEVLAFQEALVMPLRDIESEMNVYIRKSIAQYMRVQLSPIDLDREVQIVELSPAFEDARLGELLVAMGRYDEARVRLAASAEAEPARPDAFEALGFLDSIEGNRERSRSYLEQAVAKGSTNPMAHFSYTQSLLSDYTGTVMEIPTTIRESALDSLRKTLAAEPFHSDAARLYGFLSLFGTTEDFADGRAVVGKALERHRGHAQLLFVLGQLYAKQENYTAAKVIYENLLARELSPDLVAMIRHQLDYVLVKTGAN
jgi:tetratricopeptide (TPR) repeat protein